MSPLCSAATLENLFPYRKDVETDTLFEPRGKIVHRSKYRALWEAVTKERVNTELQQQRHQTIG